MQETLQWENEELAEELENLKEVMEGVQKSNKDSASLLTNTAKVLNEMNEKVSHYEDLKEENNSLYKNPTPEPRSHTHHSGP